MFENPRVWGQHSKAIRWDSNIDVWFSEKVMNEWEGFQSRHRTKLPSWSTFAAFIHSLKIKPFKSKSCLGRLHLTNRFAELGFCARPTPVELGLWIAQSPGLGAFAGLEALGFQLRTANDAVLAVSMIHADILHHFDDAFRTEIDYSCIVLENMLCKVSRLVKYLPRLSKKFSIWVWALDYLAVDDTSFDVAAPFDLDVFRQRTVTY